MRSLTNFFVLFIAISLGIFASNRLEDLWSMYLLKSAAKIAQEASENQRLKSRTERLNSQTGKALLRSCQDWKKLYQQTPTYTSKRESEKQCANYQNYIETGAIPKK
jgi:hypothetical protein